MQNYAKGAGRNVTYPLGLIGSSVGSTWGVDRSSFAIVDKDGKVAFITSNSVPYTQRYNTYKQAMITTLDQLTSTTNVERISDETPNGFVLHNNSPNPFTTKTEIHFSLGQDAISNTTRLVIYDLLGREVRTVTNSHLNVGTYAFTWDGRNNQGQRIPAGIYFYVLESGANRAVKRLVYLGR